MNGNGRMFALMFALVTELSVFLLVSVWAGKWLAKTWKWDESLVLVGFIIIAFVGWFFHVTKALNTLPETSESGPVPGDSDTHPPD